MAYALHHPSHFLSEDLTGPLRKAGAAAEELGQLHPVQLEIIFREEWLKMLAPIAYGGKELPLPRVLEIEEGLAWADGSSAWVVTLCGGAGWFAGFLDPDLAKEVMSESKLCFAGSGAATGTANLLEGKYKLNGSWKYASGSIHATAFTANFRMQEDGKQVLADDGSPLVRAFLLKRNEVTLDKTWNSMGMIATGSHAFEVTDLLVPKNRCFTIDGKAAVIRSPLYQYPFLQLAETTLTVNLSGLASRFLNLCDELFLDRAGHEIRDLSPAKNTRELLQSARQDLDNCRLQFYSAAQNSWNACVQGQPIADEVLSRVSKASQALAQRSLQAVEALYLRCGLLAADHREEINRVWRNIHTASQHSLFQF